LTGLHAFGQAFQSRIDLGPVASMTAEDVVRRIASSETANSGFQCLTPNQLDWDLRKELVRQWVKLNCQAGVAPKDDVASVPVVFIHRMNLLRYREDDLPYLQLTVRAACELNKNVIVLLIGETTPIELDHRAEVIYVDSPQHAALQDFRDLLNATYVSMTTNPSDYQFQNLQRWALLANFVRQRHLDVVAYVDSDVLLLTDMTAEYNCQPIPRPEVMLMAGPLNPLETVSPSLAVSGHTSIWQADILQLFVHYMQFFFARPEALAHYNETIWTPHKQPLGDMPLLGRFIHFIKINHIARFSNLETNDAAGLFDDNGIYLKRASHYRQDPLTGLPFLVLDDGHIQRVKSIHFQGSKKSDLLLCAV
jgi:hypothetical protein